MRRFLGWKWKAQSVPRIQQAVGLRINRYNKSTLNCEFVKGKSRGTIQAQHLSNAEEPTPTNTRRKDLFKLRSTQMNVDRKAFSKVLTTEHPAPKHSPITAVTQANSYLRLSAAESS